MPRLGRLVLSLSSLIASASAVLPTVQVGCNQYAGVTSYSGITKWLGLRYAAPPVGDLRFSPPEDPICYSGTQTASAVSNRIEFLIPTFLETTSFLTRSQIAWSSLYRDWRKCQQH